MKENGQNNHTPKSMGFIDDYSHDSIHNRSTVRKTEGKPVYSNPLENETKPKRKITKMSRKRYRKQNVSLWLICFFLAAVSAVSLFFIIGDPLKIKNTPTEENVLQNGDTTDTASGIKDESNNTENNVVMTPTVQDGSDKSDKYITVSNKDVHKGNLILVNYKYKYVFPEEDVLVSMYQTSDAFSVNTKETYAQTEAIDSFCALTEALYENSGCDDVIVVSAFRSIEKQQAIYQDRLDRYGSEYAAAYVADPGYSEHHTGLAFDLQIYADDGLTYGIDAYEDSVWFMENFTKYGYILRYPEHKASITSINFEGWHYRYVSLPHSLIMEQLDLCLEEYTDHLKNYTYDGKLLAFNKLTNELAEADASSAKDQTDCYFIYYVPSDEGDTTSVPILSGYEYTVSGNNVDGFIVTVSPNE